ncbi:MAG: aminoacyl-tRNA hydrolase [Pirellulales bacterium]|nr:aminoacyl-tRNA hydrolase [Pirellulales bacterium]
MKLVAGLGNPGRKYDDTRHNVGFAVANELAKRHAQGTPKAAFKGDAIEATIAGQKTVLLWPMTFMNKSGASVVLARDFYKLTNQDVLIVCDDFNLALGKLRLRPKGSAGGQNGLDDVIRMLGTDEVPRLRFGIGPVPPQWEHADFVLGKFNKDEKPVLAEMIVRAADAVECWIRDGVQAGMTKYN